MGTENPEFDRLVLIKSSGGSQLNGSLWGKAPHRTKKRQLVFVLDHNLYPKEINTLRPSPDGRYFAGVMFEIMFFYWNCCILFQISM